MVAILFASAATAAITLLPPTLSRQPEHFTYRMSSEGGGKYVSLPTSRRSSLNSPVAPSSRADSIMDGPFSSGGDGGGDGERGDGCSPGTMSPTASGTIPQETLFNRLRSVRSTKVRR